MPSLGADMEAGTLVEWRKQPGDHFVRGDIMAEVETDKGIIEVEVFTSGVVERHLVHSGAKVPVGTPLALLIEDAGGSPAVAGAAEHPVESPDARPASAAPSAPVARSASREAIPPATTPRAPPDRAKVSPAARRRASELGVDAAVLVGTGPEGAVTLSDVERSATASKHIPPSPPPGGPAARVPDEAKLRMRRAIAAAMARSKREIPHYYVSHTMDLAATLAWLAEYNGRVGPPDRVLPAVLFIKAVALALRDFPAFNGFWLDGCLVPSDRIHVGAAIALRGGGLVAPALSDTDRCTLPDLMHRFRDLVARARAGSLRSSELSDPTITVTSLGDRGTEAVLGIIYPPQVAIVGFGRVVERPWVVAGAVVPRPVLHLSLAADHRATDGHVGALFLAAISERLAQPERL
jgi:pyruvate dehydrogenase E2 component (dihydrolipoamide acetyltransferase)